MNRFIAALVFFFAITPSAHAALDVTISPTTQAGAPADVTLAATFASSPSSIAVHLPPGLVGNPNATPLCPVATFRNATCPANTQVGSASATSGIFTLNGGVFNLAPEPGEPARLGITTDLLAPFVTLVRNEASISLRPDGGLDSTIAQVQNGGLSIDALTLTLDSTFMTLPTSCQAATVTLNGDSDQFTPTGCANVPFAPSVAASLDNPKRTAPSGATVTLSLPAGNSHVRRTDIVLPEGTTLNPGVADGLAACTQAQFDGAGCPASSQVGTVNFVTPLLPPLGGKVFFGDGFRLYVLAAGSGVQVKLAGDTKLNPANGQITTSFDNLPQVPFSSFALSFQGGPHAVLANPSTCGTKTLDATLTPWSGTAPKHATATFTVDGCPGPGFAPALKVSSSSTAAGRPAGAVTMEITRPDGSEDISRVATELPPGLAGSLKGVPVCPEANANAGTCPADTRVGSVSSLAGSGDAPVALNGSVSLTGPAEGGLAGLAITIPGKVGPVDLGTVIVRAGILLRPDGGLTVKTTPLPRFIGGVPVSIRSLALTLDRPGFILNSSSCALQQVRAVLDGADGSNATVTAPYQATDCQSLAFKPKLEATIGKRGKTGKGSHPPLRAIITVPAGQASTASADVALPPSLGIDLKRLSAACPVEKFTTGTCAPNARIGAATATTPLLPGSLSSPVTLGIPKAGELPGIALTLTGPVTLPLFGQIGLPGKDKRIHNTFAGIPDVPLERFDLTFTSAPLLMTQDACHGKRQTVLGTFNAHNGATVKLSAKLKVEGCPPAVTLKRSGITVKPGRDGAKIRTVKLGSRKVKTKQKLHLRAGKRYKVTVTDAGRNTWKLTVRVRR